MKFDNWRDEINVKLSFPTRERGLKCTLSNPNTILYSVVPHAGTWIEISLTQGLLHPALVVPHAGTWIEIICENTTQILKKVVPHAGTWIEIARDPVCRNRALSRSPRGNVD